MLTRDGRESHRARVQIVERFRLPSDVLSPAIEVEDLVKTYGEVEAVRGVSFTVAAGEVFGFLGPNGAGKSTTINMLCTLARPTSDTARVSGFDVAPERDAVRRHLGLVFQDPTLDGQLTATQNLRLHAELYDIDRDAIPTRMDQMLEMVDLTDRRDQPVMTCSGGMKRRLEIARGLMHGRGGALRPHRHHRPGGDRRAGHARGAQTERGG